MTGLYKQAGIAIPKDIAGLLLSAVISDTVLFRSPTCTEEDKKTAAELAAIAGVDVEKYGMEMLKAGAGPYPDLTPEEIAANDMKEFSDRGKTFTISQPAADTTDLLAKRETYCLNALEKSAAHSYDVASS